MKGEENMDREMKKRTSNQRSKILEALRHAGSNGLTNVDLSKIALRFQSRLHELYIQGYGVKTTMYEGGLTHYLLIWEPIIPLTEQPRALDVLLFEIERNYGGVITTDELIQLLNKKEMGVQRKGGSYKQQADMTPRFLPQSSNPQISLDI